MGRLHLLSHTARALALGLLLVLPAGPALAQDAAACDAGLRLFEDRLLVGGALCVPDVPSRPAFLDDMVIHALELGIPSVARQYYSDVIVADFPGLAPGLDPATTVDLGRPWEMSGEALLAAEPDLVVSSPWLEAANAYAGDIAPTLILDTDEAESWRDTPRLLARLFGKETQQAALEAGVDARVAAFRDALDKAGVGRSFSFTQVEDASSFWTFTADAFGPEFALAAGLELGASIPTPEVAATMPGGSSVALPVSQENLAFIDADHLFFYANLGSDAEDLVRDNAVFQRFAAARPGRIHFLEGEYWFRSSASSAHRILDDLYRAVLGVDPESVAPNPMAWTYRTD